MVGIVRGIWSWVNWLLNWRLFKGRQDMTVDGKTDRQTK